MNVLLSGIENKEIRLSLRYKNKHVHSALPGILNSKPFPFMNGLGNLNHKLMSGR